MPVSDDFLRELQEAFQVEAREHLQGITEGLLVLERGGDAAVLAAVVERIFRDAHSLKGAARAVDFSAVERICQAIEHIFYRWKREGVRASPELYDTLQRALDVVTALLADSPAVELARVDGTVSALTAALVQPGTVPPSGPAPVPAPEAAPGPPPPRMPEADPGPDRTIHPRARGGETIRVSVQKIAEIFTRAEELIATRQALQLRHADARRLARRTSEFRRSWDEVGVGRSPDDLLAFLKGLEEDLVGLTEALYLDHRTKSRMVDDLLDDARLTLLQPFSTLLEVLPKVVRDLAREQGKRIDLRIQGADIEVDRRILESLRDPLIHLLRNCADHGIEPPEEREQARKPANGTIRIDVRRVEGSKVDSSKVEVVVADDGRGVDLPRLKARAVERGLLSEQDAAFLDGASALQLIFKSDLSTSPIVTEISGRGLGMSIVRENVERIGGTVGVESRKGAGTRFVMVFPVTLATFRGVVVRTRGRCFVIPSLHVEGVLRVARSDVLRAEDRETLVVRGRPVSLVPLGAVLGVPSVSGEGRDPDRVCAVIVAAGGVRVAFEVDEVLYEQEGLVKGLGRQLRRVRNISGCTVMGREGLIPILHAQELVVSARTVAPGTEVSAPARDDRVRSILVAEDSITSRMTS